MSWPSLPKALGHGPAEKGHRGRLSRSRVASFQNQPSYPRVTETALGHLLSIYPGSWGLSKIPGQAVASASSLL
jgi:hypothetical protein